MNVSNLPRNREEKHDRRRATFSVVASMKIIETHFVQVHRHERIETEAMLIMRRLKIVLQKNYSMRKQTKNEH